jgi:hypothetical protein
MEAEWGEHLQYRHLINGYRRFDPSRGMDYRLDLAFRDTKTGQEVHKRYKILISFVACVWKPLAICGTNYMKSGRIQEDNTLNHPVHIPDTRVANSWSARCGRIVYYLHNLH